jgi:hypothetical protein
MFYMEKTAIRLRKGFDSAHILFDLGIYLADEDLARGIRSV